MTRVLKSQIYNDRVFLRLRSNGVRHNTIALLIDKLITSSPERLVHDVVFYSYDIHFFDCQSNVINSRGELKGS